MRYLLTILFLLFLASPVWGAVTYYVDADAAGGGDGSLATPWNTTAQAVAGSTTSDTILFDKGDVFYTTDDVDVPASTQTWGAYGSGAHPKIVTGSLASLTGPDGNGEYYVASSSGQETGNADAGSDVTHIVDAGQAWAENAYNGDSVGCDTDASGNIDEDEIVAISDTAAETLTLATALPEEPDSKDFYIIPNDKIQVMEDWVRLEGRTPNAIYGTQPATYTRPIVGTLSAGQWALDYVNNRVYMKPTSGTPGVTVVFQQNFNDVFGLNNKDDVTIKDLEIVLGNHGINANNGSSGLIVTGCVIRGALDHGMNIDASLGSVTTKTEITDGLNKGVMFSDAGTTSGTFGPGNYVHHIAQLDCDNADAQGVCVGAGSADTRPSGVTITGNEIAWNGHDVATLATSILTGITVDGADSITIDSNDIHDNYRIGIYAHTSAHATGSLDDLIITNNLIRNNGKLTSVSSGAGGVLVAAINDGNTVASPVIANNVFYGNDADSDGTEGVIRIRNSAAAGDFYITDIVCVNNITSENTGDSAVFIDIGSAGAEFTISDFDNNGYNNSITDVDYAGTDRAIAALCSNEGYECAGVDADPKFRKPSAGTIWGFDLRGGSPYINKGTTGTGIPLVDIHGHSRSIGGAPDIGIDENYVIHGWF